MTKKLNPKCFKNWATAYTATGYLVPCCYCDNPETMNDSNFKKLLDASKVEESNSIEDILLSDEWSNFRDNLKKDIAPNVCFRYCGQNKTAIKKTIYIDGKEQFIYEVK